MQHVLVALKWENHLVTVFCNLTLWMPPCFGCPGPSPRSPHPLLATGPHYPRSEKRICLGKGYF